MEDEKRNKNTDVKSEARAGADHGQSDHSSLTQSEYIVNIS
jgi:hypothetical protein